MTTPVLIVTPLHRLGELIQNALQATGQYRAAVIENGAQARAHSGLCEVVILDCDAHEPPFAQQAILLRAQMPDALIVALCPDRTEDCPSCESFPLDACLRKPVQIDNLIDWLREALEARKKSIGQEALHPDLSGTVNSTGLEGEGETSALHDPTRPATGSQEAAAAPEMATTPNPIWEIFIENESKSGVPKNIDPATLVGIPAAHNSRRAELTEVHLESDLLSLHNLSYACLLIPRLPRHTLTGLIATWLEGWIEEHCIIFGWRLNYLSICPAFLHWIVSPSPAESPASIVQSTRQQSSRAIFARFPNLIKENPSGDFWAPGSLIMSGREPLQPSLIAAMITEIRYRQGILPGEMGYDGLD